MLLKQFTMHSIVNRTMAVFAIFCVLSCRPIKVEVCVLGVGYGMCTLADGTQVEKTPEQLENYICSNPDDFGKLIRACKKQ